MVFYLEAIAKAAQGHAGLKQDRGMIVTPEGVKTPSLEGVKTLSEAEEREGGEQRIASIEPIDKMPDVYTAFDSTGKLIGRASVQKFSLSSELRSRLSAEAKLWVMIEWNQEFQGYEILEIAVPPGPPSAS